MRDEDLLFGVCGVLFVFKYFIVCVFWYLSLCVCLYIYVLVCVCVFVCICHRVCQSTVECGCATQPQIGWTSTARHCHRFTVVTLKDTEAKAL